MNGKLIRLPRGTTPTILLQCIMFIVYSHLFTPLYMLQFSTFVLFKRKSFNFCRVPPFLAIKNWRQACEHLLHSVSNWLPCLGNQTLVCGQMLILPHIIKLINCFQGRSRWYSIEQVCREQCVKCFEQS